MNKIYTYLLVLASCLFLSACLFEGGGRSSDSLIIGKSETDEAEKNRRERVRNANSGDCGEYRDCEEVCEEVYDEDGDRENEGKVERCLDLSYKVAITFEEILELIEEPNYDDLKNIEDKNFEKFLNVSLAPWVEKTKRLNNDEAEALLKWIASKSKVADAIDKAEDNKYRDYDEVVESLFEEIAPNLTYPNNSRRNCAELCSAVAKERLGKDHKTFWGIITDDDSKNFKAKELVCDILKVKCNGVIVGIINDDCPSEIKSGDDSCRLE